MTQTPTTVVGKGVYLEFVKGTMTTQILVLPEGMTTSHKLIPMTMFRRRISTVQPRKTWTMVSSSTSSSVARAQLIASGVSADLETAIVKKMTGFIDPLLSSLYTNNWKLFKGPIVIEITTEDLELARQARTPHKAMGRILKVRKKLGYPKELIHASPEIVTPAPTY